MKAPLFDDGAAREETLEQANVALANEINNRKQAEAALREQAQLLELSCNTIMVRRLDNTITFWNHGAEELYGWTKAEALGKSSHTLLQTEYPQPLEELESALLEHGRWEGELIHTRRDGTRAVVASRWATERKQMEQELQESAASIRALYQLSRTAQLSFEERCQQLLAMGCRQFQLDFGRMQVVVAGKVYGVLCFCSPSPCPRRITAMDKELLKLMAQWVGGEIERQQVEEALRQAHDELEVRIGKRTVDLATANVALKKEIALPRFSGGRAETNRRIAHNSSRAVRT